jgi:hypothetical protein
VDGLDRKERETFDNDLNTDGPGSWADVQVAALARLDEIADERDATMPAIGQGGT